MRFRPCIDLHQGKVKQIVGSTFESSNHKENFISRYDSDYYARIYQSDQLKGAHIIQLGEGNEESSKKAVEAFPNGFQIGGGININNASYWINLGVSHIIVTSFLFQNGNIIWDNLYKLIESIGSNHIVVDLSCSRDKNDYYIMTDRWQIRSKIKLSESLFHKLSPYVDEFLIHAIDIEGKKSGIDKRLVDQLSLIKDVIITYAGGIDSYNDIEYIDKKSNSKLDYTVGSSLDIFGGHLSYKRIVNEFHHKN